MIGVKDFEMEGPQETQSNHTGLKNGRGKQGSGSERCNVRRTPLATDDLEDGGKDAIHQEVQVASRSWEHFLADSP